MMILVLGALFGFLFNQFSPSGISVTENNPVPDVKEEAAQENVPTVSLNEAFQYFSEGSVVFVDARPPELFSEGRIEGAFNIPEHSMEEHLAEFCQMIPPEVPVVVYCDGQDCVASLKVARALGDAGFQNVQVFYGGWYEWMNAGFPIGWD
jgi:rhodanese-related sulfurtransferase